MAMNIVGAVARFINPQPLYGMRQGATIEPLGRMNTAHVTDMYRVLRAYYKNNALYDVIADVLRRQGVWKESMKAIRNPTYRVVEFHAGHLWPGTLPAALPIMAKRDAIVAPIQQVWQWSNWAAKKQVAARHNALFGDFFLKVAQTPDRSRVFFQLIEPEHVTDFDTDERDFMTYVRFDVPELRRNADGSSERYLHTEEWSMKTGLFRVWESDTLTTTGSMPATAELGNPKTSMPIEEMGIDFIPVVRAPFADIGEPRGMGAIIPAIDKIDEANRQATRLAQLLFRHNKVTHALEANSVDAAGRPLPPPRLTDTQDVSGTDPNTVTIGDDEFYLLPGMSTLKQLVPNINYEAALHVLQDHMLELEQDLPELVMYRISESGNLSGRAVRLMLAPAIARLEEARGNAESALIRADQMALTMGQNAKLWDVGDFQNGDFEHAFEERDVLPNDELERGQTEQAEGAALASLVAAGMPIEMAAQQVYGWTEERAAQFTAARLAAIQRQQALATEDVTEPVVTQ